MSKNYCNEHEVQKKATKSTKVTWKEKCKALWAYLHKPKTIFDFKDRLKAIVLLIVVIVLGQYIVRYFLR